MVSTFPKSGFSFRVSGVSRCPPESIAVSNRSPGTTNSRILKIPPAPFRKGELQVVSLRSAFFIKIIERSDIHQHSIFNPHPGYLGTALIRSSPAPSAIFSIKLSSINFSSCTSSSLYRALSSDRCISHSARARNTFRARFRARAKL